MKPTASAPVPSSRPAVQARWPGSLAGRFAWAAALLASLAVALISAGSWWWVDHLQREATRALQTKDTELRAARVASTLRSLQARVAEMTTSPLLTTALTDSEGRDAYLRPYLNSVQTIDAVAVELLLVDFQGTELARNADSSLSPAQRERLHQQLQLGRAGAWIDGPPGQHELLAVTMVLYPRTGTVEGALLLKLGLNQLLTDPNFRLLPSVAEAASAPGAAAPVGKAGTVALRERTAGAPELQATVAMPAAFSPVQLQVRGRPPPLDSGLPGRGQLAGAAVLATLVLVLGVVLIGTHLARRLTRELGALNDFAHQVAEQAFGENRAPLTGPTEVHALALSLNRMLDRLNQQHARLQDAAQAQLRLLGTCIEQLNDVVMITEAAPEAGSTQYRIVFVNEAFVRLTGYARHEVLGKTPQMLQGPASSRAELDRIRAALQRWEPVRAEVLNYTKDGREVWIEMAIVPVKDAEGQVTHWVSVERDTSARREAENQRQQLEAQLREVQKMEAIGTLAGGIAHDFNNVLAAILGNVSLAQQALRAPAPAPGAAADSPVHAALPALAQIRQSAERARSLVQQILTFSRRQTQPQAPQALRPLVEETVALLRATVPTRVQLHTRVQAEDPGAPLRVLGDATALSQVLMNLGTNAWHALSGSTGRIDFGLEALDWPEQAPNPLPAHAAQLAPGPVAHLWVADNGCGIDADTQARIFEPFFTTKPVGSGTGMGLSVVLGIVQAHGGLITLDSAPGRGSCFHVYLPLLTTLPAGSAAHDLPGAAPAAKAAGAQADERAAGLADPAQQGRGQQVLYVDDDEVMRTLVQALLEGCGYRVHTLRQASAALQWLRAPAAACDVLVTDFNMPELSGLELLRAVKALRPALPVVLTSGYIPDELRDEALHSGAVALLRKENIADELTELLARVLSEVAARPEQAE